jgi:hypothetical protein
VTITDATNRMLSNLQISPIAMIPAEIPLTVPDISAFYVSSRESSAKMPSGLGFFNRFGRRNSYSHLQHSDRQQRIRNFHDMDYGTNECAFLVRHKITQQIRIMHIVLRNTHREAVKLPNCRSVQISSGPIRFEMTKIPLGDKHIMGAFH